MKATYEDILGAIVTLKNEETLRRINTVVCDQIRAVTALKNVSLRLNFVSGQQVKFKGRRGITEKGIIESMGPKKAVVKTEFSSWRVPYRMLKDI